MKSFCISNQELHSHQSKCLFDYNVLLTNNYVLFSVHYPMRITMCAKHQDLSVPNLSLADLLLLIVMFSANSTGLASH